MQRICVQWPRLGPYHLARLRAAHEFFDARGCEVVALETAGTDDTYGWRRETAPERFERVQLFPNRVAEALAPRRVYDAMTRTLDRLRPDAVAITSYSTPDAQAALLWCRRHRRTAVCMLASKADDAARNPLRETLKGVIVQQFDAGLAGGTPQQNYLLALGLSEERVFVPYDVVDNGFFRVGAETARRSPEAVRHLPGLDDPRPFFLASNRFVERKNLTRLLSAYGSYRQSAGDAAWRLVMLGDGPLRSTLEAQAKSLEDVTFAGFQQIEALPAYYGLAGAFVHPALQEQWGLVINEAMAAGLPVVASDRLGATPDLVLPGETGYRFPPESEAELASCLSMIAALPPEQRTAMGTRAQEVVADWSPERFAGALWAAVRAGAETADRPATLLARALLWIQRTTSRRADTFHALRD